MRFCIVGTGRCGTTLLWRMLNAHPDLFVYRETHWLPALHEAFGLRAVPTGALLDLVARTRFVTGDPVTPLDADAFRQSPGYRKDMTVAAFCDALGAFHAAAEGKTVWADKTPDYGYFVSVLQLYWPGCRVIHLIRDGVRTAQSMSRHVGYRALAALDRRHWPPLALDYVPPAEGFGPGPPERFADLWHDRLLRIRDEAARLAPGSYMELRHEDLTADPVPLLRRIAGDNGLAEDPAWLAAAAAMVDAGRGAGRGPDEPVPAHFGDRHRALLRDLGYPDGRA